MNALLKYSPDQFPIIPGLHDSIRRIELHRFNAFYVLAAADTTLAVLNVKTCQILRRLDEFHHMYYQAIVCQSQWDAARSSWDEDPNSAILEVDIDVFGPIERADIVGGTLSESGTFLQKPVAISEGVRYYNPHYLQINHSCETDLMSTPRELIDEPRDGTTRTVEEPAYINASAEVTSILDCFSQRDFLHERLVDQRVINKPLLPYVRMVFFKPLPRGTANIFIACYEQQTPEDCH